LRRQTSVTAGTTIHASKLPLTIWFWGGVLDGDTLQRHLGAAMAESARSWLVSQRLDMCAKLRRALVNPEHEPLTGLVEADETIIPFRTKHDPIVVARRPQRVGKDAGRRRGRNRWRQAPAAWLKVIEGLGKQELCAFVLGAVAPQTRLVTDRLALLPRSSRSPVPRDRPRSDGRARRVALDASAVFRSSSAGASASTTDRARLTFGTTSTNS
jgi:hypothetical protein